MSSVYACEIMNGVDFYVCLLFCLNEHENQNALHSIGMQFGREEPTYPITICERTEDLKHDLCLYFWSADRNLV